MYYSNNVHTFFCKIKQSITNLQTIGRVFKTHFGRNLPHFGQISPENPVKNRRAGLGNVLLCASSPTAFLSLAHNGTNRGQF